MIGARHAVLLAALAVLAAASLAIALVAGSVAIHPLAVLDALRAPAGALDADIVRELRLPRALNAFATGGLLAVAGVLMQVLVRNPLADPYVLGISGGAAVGALGAILAGAAGLVVPGAAFAGAAASTALVLALGRVGATSTPRIAARSSPCASRLSLRASTSAAAAPTARAARGAPPTVE